jgi:ribose 5-phosphate isomerase
MIAAPAARAGLDEIYEQAAQARRTVKAAAGGKKALAAQPGRFAPAITTEGDYARDVRDGQGARNAESCASLQSTTGVIMHTPNRLV